MYISKIKDKAILIGLLFLCYKVTFFTSTIDDKRVRIIKKKVSITPMSKKRKNALLEDIGGLPYQALLIKLSET